MEKATEVAIFKMTLNHQFFLRTGIKDKMIFKINLQVSLAPNMATVPQRDILQYKL